MSLFQSSSGSAIKAYDGPTGDVNTAFLHLVNGRLLPSAGVDGVEQQLKSFRELPVAVRASPIYRAVIHHAQDNTEQRETKDHHPHADSGNKDKHTAQISRGVTGTNASNAAMSPAVPAAAARRGVVPRDPLLLRQLRREQQSRARAVGGMSCAAVTAVQPNANNESNREKVQKCCTGTAEGGLTGENIPHQGGKASMHWSRRPLQSMTTAGWDVFRQQMGIRIEVVARRRPSSSSVDGRTTAISDDSVTGKQLLGTTFSSDALRPIRCWEEARLPLALGTVVARRFLLPTPIQSQCVPLALASPCAGVAEVPQPGSGKRIDVLAVAETGSGKTAAYLIPLLATIVSPPMPSSCDYGKQGDKDAVNDSAGGKHSVDRFVSQGPLALVVVPTRELAEQVTREAQHLIGGVPKEEMQSLLQCERRSGASVVDGCVGDGGPYNALNAIRVVKIVGGELTDEQYDELVAGAHVVVGTVGQLEALLAQRLLALGKVRVVVIDEADRMLIERQQQQSLIAVLERCPQPRQTLMFTATLGNVCEGIANKYFSPSGYVLVRAQHSCTTIVQAFEVVASDPGVASETTVSHDNGVCRESREGGGYGGEGPATEGENPKRRRQPREGEACRNPLVHPVKFSRLVNYLVYAASPIVVFANEKRTCDALSSELGAEVSRLGSLIDSFSLEALVGEAPKVLEGQQDQQSRSGKLSSPLDNISSVAVVHSEQSQAQRQRLVEAFRSGAKRVLITTDLLARGLDVPNIALVINYDMPLVFRPLDGGVGGRAEEEEGAVQKYIHRIGRTGRAGESGVAVSFVALPSALVQRAQQHISRSGGNSSFNNSTVLAGMQLNGGGDRFVMGKLSQVVDPWASEKSRAQKRDRCELTEWRTNTDAEELFLPLHPEGEEYSDSDGESDGVGGSGGVRSWRRGKRTAGGESRSRHHAEGQEAEGPVGSSFLSDELVLQPLWKFLVSCAEANCATLMNGSDVIRNQQCRQIQIPTVLAVLMHTYAQRSSHGTIVT